MQHSCPQATHGKHLNLLPPTRAVARHTYPRQMETAPGKRRSNLLFTASFQLVEKALKDFRQVAFGVINYVLPQTNGAEFQILSYLCPLLCTGGGEFVQEGGEFILVLQHKDNKLLSIYRNI